MALAAALSCIFFAACLRSAGAVRAEESAAFVYPAECQESCTVPFAVGLGTSGEQFKCVLKDVAVLPKGRSCAAPEKRSQWTYTSGQWRTICAFTPDEVASKAWEGLEQKCSTETWCCCNKEDEWTEDVCMAMGTEAPQVFAVSPKSKVEERYERVAQQYDNTEGDCPEGVPYQKDHNSDLTSKGCCLKSEEMTKSKTKQCSGLMRCSETKKWTGCATWQRLYRCSGDGGHTQTGQMYKRVPRRRGVCLGSESTPERLMHAHGAAAGSELATAFKGLKLELGEVDLASGERELECPAKYDYFAGGKPCLCDIDCRDKRSYYSKPPIDRVVGEPLAELA